MLDGVAHHGWILESPQNPFGGKQRNLRRRTICNSRSTEGSEPKSNRKSGHPHNQYLYGPRRGPPKNTRRQPKPRAMAHRMITERERTLRRSGWHIEYYGVPGHAKVEGNEKADLAAKDAARNLNPRNLHLPKQRTLHNTSTPTQKDERNKDFRDEDVA